MPYTTKDRLTQMNVSMCRNAERIRAFIDRNSFRECNIDERERALAHYKMRLADLIAKGAHRIRPDITDRYEEDIMFLESKIERTRRKEERNA